MSFDSTSFMMGAMAAGNRDTGPSAIEVYRIVKANNAQWKAADPWGYANHQYRLAWRRKWALRICAFLLVAWPVADKVYRMTATPPFIFG